MWHTHVAVTQEDHRSMSDPKLDLLQGTLDLMVLQTLAAMGEQHGYGIARRIEQISRDTILLNQGTLAGGAGGTGGLVTNNKEEQS